MENKYIEQDRYDSATRRVRCLRRFYVHAVVYVVVNLMILILIAQDLDEGESFFHWHNFATLIFWGIGLMAHGLTVFLPNFILGKDWEERKIKELMHKDRNRWK